MSNSLIIDGGNFLHRVSYAVASSIGSEPPVFGPEVTGSFLGAVRKVSWRFLPNSVFIVWDSGRSTRRIELYPNYKSNRTNWLNDKGLPDEEMKNREWETISEITKLLSRLGCRFVTVPGKEADDVISKVSKDIGGAVVCSDDKDFFQLIPYKVSIYRPLADEFISELTFREKFGIASSQWLLYKSMVGDESDSINGVHGIGDVLARKFLNAAGEDVIDPDNFLHSLEKMKKTKKLESLLNQFHILKRNFLLLNTDYEDFSVEDTRLVESSIQRNVRFDESVSRDIEKLGINWIPDHFTTWSTPFRRLT